VLAKAVTMPSYKVWYPLVLIGGLAIGAWFVCDTAVDTARTGAAILAVVFLADAVYTGYSFKQNPEMAENSMVRYGIYGSVIISVILALFLGYAAI
jgi:hypothetical protein